LIIGKFYQISLFGQDRVDAMLGRVCPLVPTQKWEKWRWGLLWADVYVDLWGYCVPKPRKISKENIQIEKLVDKVIV